MGKFKNLKIYTDYCCIEKVGQLGKSKRNCEEDSRGRDKNFIMQGRLRVLMKMWVGSTGDITESFYLYIITKMKQQEILNNQCELRRNLMEYRKIIRKECHI